MTAATASRTEAAAAPIGSTAIRTKRVRVTLDLDQADYAALNRWIGTAAIEMNPDLPRLSLARTLRAMIRVTLADTGIAAVVIDQARRDSGD
jgi:hypothetical protein